MPVRDSNSVAAGTGSGPTLLALPATVQDGDRGVLAILQGGSQAITVNTPGWSATSGAQGTSSTTLRLTLYEKILTAAEAGTNVSVSFAGSQQHVLGVVVQYGVSGQDGSPAVVTDTTADALADLAGVTPSGDGREILAFAASRASVTNTAFSLATPTNYSEPFETANVGNINRNGLAVFHRVLTGGNGVPETPGGGSVAVTGATVTSVGITLALTPAAVAGRAPPVISQYDSFF